MVLHWHKRRLVCPDRHCPVSTFSEADPIADAVALPRCRLTCRAVFWAVERLRRDHASIKPLARQLSVNWHTVWDPVSAVLEYFDDNDNRFNGVTEIGVNEHLWHHQQPKLRVPKEITGMVDITRDHQGRLLTRLLDLVSGRSGAVHARWIDERGPRFAAAVQVAALDPFQLRMVLIGGGFDEHPDSGDTPRPTLKRGEPATSRAYWGGRSPSGGRRCGPTPSPNAGTAGGSPVPPRFCSWHRRTVVFRTPGSWCRSAGPGRCTRPRGQATSRRSRSRSSTCSVR